MAKKNLKRGLALGALMAFVITGSAMAADVVRIDGTSSSMDIVDGSISLNESTSDKVIGIHIMNNHTITLNNANIGISVNNDGNGTVYGARVFNEGASGGGKLSIGNSIVGDVSISATGQGFAQGLAVTRSNSSGSLDNPSLVEINAKNLTIEANSSGNWAYGLNIMNATSNPSLTDAQKSKVIINAEKTTINANATAAGCEGEGIVVMSQGILEINGDLEVNASHNAIVTRGDSKITINKNGDSTVQLNGNINFDYDAASSGTPVNADVNIKLTGADSYWNGTTQIAWSAKSDGTGKPSAAALNVDSFTLTIADGAQWNPTYLEIAGSYDEAGNGTSGSGVQYPALNNLILDNGIINLTNAKDQVKIENASGTGTVLVGAADNAMGITASNNATLTVAATSAYAEEIASNDMTAAANNLAAKVKDQTGTEAKTAASNVYIPETTVTGAVNANVGADGRVARLVEAVNATNAAVSDMASVSLMTWRQENNDMNKRLGELRDSKGQHGAWARMARGESKYGAQNVKNQYNYYQVGYDEKLSTDSNWTVGVALTRTEGTSTFTRGSGENNHTGVAVYGSYLGENGSFIDLIAKYSRMDNEYKTMGGVGDADYKTNGYSVSAEYGKRFTKDNGLWIEPQVELTYGTVGSVNYLTSKDASVSQDGIDSLVGRIGFALGKNIKAGNVYARASYLYDFDGDTNVTYSKGGVTRSFEQDLGGGWWEVGVGSNINLSNATHLYFDVEKTYGGDVATPWQWNLGVRYSF